MREGGDRRNKEGDRRRNRNGNKRGGWKRMENPRRSENQRTRAGELPPKNEPLTDLTSSTYVRRSTRSQGMRTEDTHGLI